ncbi:elongation factor P [Candidatus Gottesmanbacteria bacterium RBG_16_37_8]|uniref:Elongation factor P n=1 Tax=Candidatus Gottesmanbacteria bacterium RBG_16_37_8 TaxID=1798371 RepID=A0A1F5YQY3_9BACT|nr:MAG: elongation factor P [Candidatus Gottesmanbacteria bacterium RBG_16_37_8]
MTQISTSQFQKGMFIDYRGEIHQIIEFQHVNPGKGSAFVRTKLKNVKTGNTVEFTYKSGEDVLELPVFIREMQYLYKADKQYFFMDRNSFEQFSISDSLVGSFGNYLKEGILYQIYQHEDKILGLKYPKIVKLKVTEAEEGIRGNTVSGAKKTVILETAIKIQVPLFIKKGDILAINPDTGEYLERVND